MENVHTVHIKEPMYRTVINQTPTCAAIPSNIHAVEVPDSRGNNMRAVSEYMQLCMYFTVLYSFVTVKMYLFCSGTPEDRAERHCSHPQGRPQDNDFKN